MLFDFPQTCKSRLVITKMRGLEIRENKKKAGLGVTKL